LKVKHDKLLSNFAFKCKLRHYTEVELTVAKTGAEREAERARAQAEVGDLAENMLKMSGIQRILNHCVNP